LGTGELDGGGPQGPPTYAAGMAQRIEARLPDALVWFDGTVLEIFGRSEHGASRFHVDGLQDVSFDDGIIMILHQVGARQTILSAPSGQASGAAELVDAVKSAISSSTPLG
jgi:hypothetical protein